VCKLAIQSVSIDPEVSQIGLNTLFNMLKMSNYNHEKPPVSSATTALTTPSSPLLSSLQAKSLSSSSGDNGNIQCKLDLWNFAWVAVKDASTFSSPSSDLALQMCQSLQTLYNENIDVFQHGSKLKIFLEVVVVISRPRIEQSDDHKALAVKKVSILSSQQLQRSIMSILKDIKFVEPSSIYYYVSTLAEICFATHIVELYSPLYNEVIHLGPCPEKLRTEVGKFILDILSTKFSSLNLSFRDSKVKLYDSNVILDILLGRLINDEYATLLAARYFENNLLKEETSHLEYSSILEKIWDRKLITGHISDSELEFHKLRQSVVSNPEEVIKSQQSTEHWDGYILSSLEIDLILTAWEMCAESSFSSSAWQKIVTVLSCLLSPWKLAETAVEKVLVLADQSVEHDQNNIYIKKVCFLLDKLFDISFQQRSVISSFLNTLV
jgi:hypothetical protein